MPEHSPAAKQRPAPSADERVSRSVDGRQREAQRQSAWLQAAWHSPFDAPCPSGVQCPPGLPRAWRAYTSHAQAASAQVLQAAYPTIGRMVGDEALAVLAWRLWQAHPPEQGDLNAWGACLPDLILGSTELAEWPYLADAARLDWLQHLCAQAPDAQPDLSTLAHLGDTAPEQLWLQLRPDVGVLTSTWPVQTLWSLHRGDATLDTRAEEGAAASLANALEHALLTPQPEAVVVWREGWAVQCDTLSADMVPWMVALTGASGAPSCPPAQAPSLGDLLADQPEQFDFTAWLTLALQRGWVWRLQTQPQAEPPALKNPSA